MSSTKGVIQSLLRCSGSELGELSRRPGPQVEWACIGTICLGGALYGCTLGLWRDETQSLFTAIKFPLLMLLTCGGNALLNGCLAQVLDTGIGFRQSTRAILMSFALMCLILASFAPIMLFLLANTPPLAETGSRTGHSLTLLTHVALIAAAGITGTLHLWRLLRAEIGNPQSATTLLVSWLTTNLLLGSQISWILRPFIGSPQLPVQFFREDPLRGNFFEAVGRALSHFFQT